MDCKALGLHCVKLGGGRQVASDVIDFSVGFVMNKKIGDKVKKGELLVTIHCHDHQMDMARLMAADMSKKDIIIETTKPRAKKKLIIEVQTQLAPIKKKNNKR